MDRTLTLSFSCPDASGIVAAEPSPPMARHRATRPMKRQTGRRLTRSRRSRA